MKPWPVAKSNPIRSAARTAVARPWPARVAVWREGEPIVSLKLPGTDVQLMLDAAEPDGGSAFGPIFVLDDVNRFFAERPAALRASGEPDEIPGGFLATFQDPSGNTIYVMDQSTEAG